MKSIKRYSEHAYGIDEDPNGAWCKYYNIKKLQKRIKELESAERTLNQLGYTNQGGELWKPPIGKPVNFGLVEQLQIKMNQLINDIRSANSLADLKRHVGPSEEDNQKSINRLAEMARLDNQYKSFENMPDSVIERYQKLLNEQVLYESEFC